MKFFIVVTVFCMLAVSVPAQDPLQTLPEVYKLQFENDWVKVTRVHYEPRVKLPDHEHTLTAAAYVYLNDSGPVVFKHKDTTYGPVTRPATKAGSFRLYRSIQEHHEVESQSDLPSDFLRVEFKTDPKDENSLRGKFFRENYKAGENFQKEQFENDQVRITRLVCAPGKALLVTTAEPSLLVALTPGQLRASRNGGKASSVKLDLGQTRWVDNNQLEKLENTGVAAMEMLRFDFKTAPLSKEALEKKKEQGHPKK